jgi:hypothetical protein
MKTETIGLLVAGLVLAAGSAAAQEYKTPLGQIKVTPTLHSSVSDGSGVTVAILDGLADPNHPEFGGRLTGIGYDTGTYTHYDNHGTHVAGIVGAAANGTGMVGVAPGATLVNVGVFDDDGWTADSSAKNALTWAVSQGATIVNMSYGPTGRGDVFLSGELAVFKTFGSSLVMVRAAGNSGANAISESFVGNPQTDLDHLLIVGSVDSNNKISSFSNKPGNACFLVNGVCSEKNKMKYYWIVAPGRSTYSTLPNGGYGTMSGTSMAAPHVAGAAALLQSEWPHLKSDPAATASILKTTATDLGSKGVDAVYGYGLLNVTKALQPVGTTTIATGSTVTSGTSTTQTGASFGGLMDQRGMERAFADLVVFDDYGRDFNVALEFARETSDGAAMLDRLGALGIALQQDGLGRAFLGDLSVAFTAGTALDGTSLTQLDLTQGGLGLTLGWGAPLGPAATLLSPAGDDPRGLLRREMALGLGEIAQDLERMTFAGGSLELAPGVTLAAFHATSSLPDSGDPVVTLSQQDTNQVSMSGARLGVDLADGLVLGLSWNQLGEQDQVLGGESSGALALSDTARSDLVGLSLAYGVTEDLSLFAFWQEGWTRADAGQQSLFDDTDDWRTRRYGVTLGLRDAFGVGDRLELAVVRPLTVTAGSGSARVPVGRTLDGQVIYQQESFDVGSDAEPLEVGLTWLGARDEWAPGRPLAYGVSLGWASDDLASDRGDASVLFALQAKF